MKQSPRGTFSDPLFFQVVDVEPVMHHSVTGDVLLDIILHVLLEFQRQIAQAQVAFLIVPGNDLGTRKLFGVFTDPRSNLFVGGAGGDERFCDVSLTLPAESGTAVSDHRY